MKIGIDLRFISDDLYSKFVLELMELFIDKEVENSYIIYTNKELKQFKSKQNVVTKNLNIENGSFAEQTSFCSILSKDRNNLVLFFNHFKPIFYKGQYITFVQSLKDVYYMDFSTYFEKYKYLFLMKRNLKKSHKIICLDSNTKSELIEKFDIKEENIDIISGFFPTLDLKIPSVLAEETDKIEVNIATTYGIKNEYFIYSGGSSIEKNYEKLFGVMDKLNKNGKNIDLVIFGYNISRNLNLRNLILDLKLQNNIYFLGDVDGSHKKLLYQKSLGTIFPSLYESFPFKLAEPLYFGNHILASDLKNIKKIFGDEISYFSPISTNNIFNIINEYLEKCSKIHSKDYKNILKDYNKEETCKQLIGLIG